MFRTKVVKQFLKTSQGSLDEKEESQSVSPRTSSLETVVDMGWYHIWLGQQLRHVPCCVRELRIKDEKFLAGSSLNTIFAAIENYIRVNEGVSIDELIQHLQAIYVLDHRKSFWGHRGCLYSLSSAGNP